MDNKRAIAVLVCTIIYSLLFFHQHAGLNFLLFSVISVAFLGWYNRQLIAQKVWQVLAGMLLFAAAFVFIHGSLFAACVNVMLLLLISAFSFRQNGSVLINFFSSLFSVVFSPVFVLSNLQGKNSSGLNKNFLKYLVIIFPLVFALIFFAIYKNANPLFEKFTRDINLNFISKDWIIFTFGGFFLMYGFFYHQRIRAVDELEDSQVTVLENKAYPATKWNEKTAAIILFVLLNAMLLLINLLDLNYLYLGAGMPDGFTHKQFVHDGVGNLVFSIILGIVLILYFFRGLLNFEPANKMIKLLVYAWIIQNVFMVFSTYLRHNLYVFDGLLSYKRIGVYYWLFMSGVGLITTAIMLYKLKSWWYLIKVNSNIALLVLVLSTSVDWDQLISNFNLGHTRKDNIAALDKHYLLSLSETNISALYAIKDEPGFEVDSPYSYKETTYPSNKNWLDQKRLKFLEKHSGADWRSYSIREARVFKEVSILQKAE
ncbi:MAG: DUF4173 domain-containing protein [Bacteroidota bacterium]|nr:DUF4173 domain-containing protein [Bacteroidota bacterium]